jgi:hypothetical protein
MTDYIFVIKQHFIGVRMIQAMIEFLTISSAVAAGMALFEIFKASFTKKKIYIKKSCVPCDCGCELSKPADPASAAWQQAASIVRCEPYMPEGDKP